MVAGMRRAGRSKSNRRLQWRPLMRNAALRRRLFKLMVSLAIYSIAAVGFAQGKSGKHRGNGDNDDEHEKQPQTGIMWINHLELLPGDSSVIMSNTTGDTATGGGNKVVEKGLQLPPGFLITGVRVCYELSNARSFIDQIRLSQVQDPPGTALVQLDDATHLVNPGPVCVDSAPTTVNPELGAVRLDLRVNFGDTSDKIVVRALGLHLEEP